MRPNPVVGGLWGLQNYKFLQNDSIFSTSSLSIVIQFMEAYKRKPIPLFHNPNFWELPSYFHLKVVPEVPLTDLPPISGIRKIDIRNRRELSNVWG